MIHGVRGGGHGERSPREQQHVGDNRRRRAWKRAERCWEKHGEKPGEVGISRRSSMRRTKNTEDVTGNHSKHNFYMMPWVENILCSLETGIKG